MVEKTEGERRGVEESESREGEERRGGSEVEEREE